MTCRISPSRFAPAVLLSLYFAIHAGAAELHGVSFAPSPSSSWRCGLSNDDLPGLAAEHMLQPVAAGCELGNAKAYAVIVDLSDSRSAMRAEQMAADAEDQLPASWKVDEKSYDVVTLPGGRFAAYSRLVGKGDGFTFLSGQTPMVAISINVPLLFEEENGVPHQAIAVFRVRSPLPSVAAEKKERIGELDRTLRDWAGSAQPAKGRTISEQDFELAAYARTKGLAAAAAASSASASPATEQERIGTAIAAVVHKNATPADLATLDDAAKRFERMALGETARFYLEEAQQRAQQSAQEQILSATLASVKEDAETVFSRFLIASVKSGDAAGIASALRIARQRGWTLRNIAPAAKTEVAAAIVKKAFPFTPSSEDRTFFELPSAEILPLVEPATRIPRIEDLARAGRGTWHIKDRRAAKALYVVQHDRTIGVLERTQGTTYAFRTVTNLLDLGGAATGQ